MPGTPRIAAAAILIALSACQQSRGTRPAPSRTSPRIELNRDRSGLFAVDVVGLPADDLSSLARQTPTRDEWRALLRVAVAGDPVDASDRPAVLGSYSIAGGALRFTPQFPFDPGQRYTVVVDPSRLPSSRQASEPQNARPIEASIEVPAPERRPTTRVVAVYPSGEVVPENQLRLYVAFSAPMERGGGADHVRLLDESGRVVADPFLPLDVDLWNEDRTRYTILFDPGRVKRGILPNEKMGRSLVAGRTYTLAVDAGWRDAGGQPLAESFRHPFRVGPADEEAIEPAAWRLEPPAPGTRDPLVVTFPKPLDYGLLQRALTVSTAGGTGLSGTIRVEAGERRWLFAPGSPWEPGDYQLLASSILEDVAGNRIGRPFEVEGAGRDNPLTASRSASVPFRIGSAR